MKVRFEITDGVNPIRIVEPYIGTDGSITWKKEDAPKFDFKKELKEITLLKEDFKYFYQLEKSLKRCDLQTLNVYVNCGIEDLLLFTGEFTMSKGVWDLDRCTVKFRVSTFDPYKCIKDNDEKVNILELPNSQTAKLGITLSVERYACVSNNNLNGYDRCDANLLKANKWSIYLYSWIKVGNVTFDVDMYVRLQMVCPCDYNPTSEWLLIEACTGGYKKYVKEYNTTVTNKIIFDAGRIKNNYQPITEIDNGRKLYSAMQFLLTSACPNLQIKSDFFQWNPDVSTSINYVTEEFSKVLNLLIFQKSDVKRANNSNNATKAEASFKEMIIQICEMFNLRYQIKGDVFRIEHLSWFERDYGLNLLNGRNENLLKGTRKYSYDETRMPKYEKFEFMESGSKDFVGVPIEYKNDCVNDDEENKVSINVDQITTDVLFALENPDPDGDVSDNGFVIIACDASNNILYEDGILESSTAVNNTLSWAHLQRDYYKHGRVYMQGYMNNQLTDFKSVVPTVKQEKFSAILGCSDIKVFNPISQIKASLGWGFIQSAEFKLSKCVMDFELFLDDIEQPDFQRDYGDFDDDFSDDFD